MMQIVTGKIALSSRRTNSEIRIRSFLSLSRKYCGETLLRPILVLLVLTTGTRCSRSS